MFSKFTARLSKIEFLSAVSIFIFFISVGNYTQADVLNFAIIGDAGEWNSSAKLTRDSIAKMNIKNTILPGDNLYSGSYSAVWNNWTQLGFTFDVVALGNHNNGYRNEMDFFKMPGEYFSKVYTDLARFIVLNSDNDQSAAEQTRFLEKELQAARERYVFLVYHHPTYTLSRTHSWDEKKNFQLAIRPLLWKYRGTITALMVGHDHLATIAHYNDLPVILSGAAKAQRDDTPKNYTQNGVQVSTDWFFDKNPYWANLILDDKSNSAEVGFIRSKDQKLSCTANIRTGQRATLNSNCSGTL